MKNGFIFLLQIVVAALVALLGRERKIGYGWGFLLCLFLSPIIGVVIILCSKKKNSIQFIDTNETSKS